MKLTYFIAFTFLSFNLFAQEMISVNAIDLERKLTWETIKSSKKSRSAKPIEELLNSGKITHDKYLSRLRIHKANLLEDNTCLNEKCEFPEKEAKEILKYYDSIVDLSDCSNKIDCELKKQGFIERLYFNSGKTDYKYKEIFDENTVRVKKMGYSPSQFGHGIGVHYFVGKEGWLGVNFSVVSGYQPKYTIRNTCGMFTCDKSSMDFLKFGYSHSFKSSTNDFSFSLLEVNAPIVLIPAKFGIQYGPYTSGSQFYYRPGIGFSIWRLSLSYSYNLMFSKAARSYSEKNLFSISYSYPIDNRWK